MLARDNQLSVSLSTQKKVKKLASYKASFIKKYGKIPTNEELEVFSGYTKKEISNSSIFLCRISSADISDIKAKEVYEEFVLNDTNNRNEEALQNLHSMVLDEYLKKTLDDTEYLVITKWYLEDESFKNISKMIGIPLGRVYTIKETALAKLQLNKEDLKNNLNR